MVLIVIPSGPRMLTSTNWSKDSLTQMLPSGAAASMKPQNRTMQATKGRRQNVKLSCQSRAEEATHQAREKGSSQDQILSIQAQPRLPAAELSPLTHCQQKQASSRLIAERSQNMRSRPSASTTRITRTSSSNSSGSQKTKQSPGQRRKRSCQGRSEEETHLASQKERSQGQALSMQPQPLQSAAGGPSLTHLQQGRSESQLNAEHSTQAWTTPKPFGAI